MKKFLSLFLLLLVFVGCSNAQMKDVTPISPAQRTVLIEYFPLSFETALEKSLEDNFWKTYVVSNQNVASKDIKSNFSITCSELYPSTIPGTFAGVVKFSDLRTGKRIGVYSFNFKTKAGIVEEIVKVMDTIPVRK